MIIDLDDIAPDYEFYSNTYHGHMGKEDFESSLPDACAEVEYYIWPYADIESCETRVKMAICAVADVTAGEVREEFSAGYSITAEAAVRRYLANTGVLKRGRWL